MKIIVIMGSPRKGNTFRACEEFRTYVQEVCDAEFEYVWLKDINMQPCKGCFVCFPQEEERCPHRGDEVQGIVRRMLEADGVVWATPVYSNDVSGLLKSFIDRISYIGHRPRFFKQKAFLIATTGMFGTKRVLKYLEDTTGRWWGFDVIGKVGLSTLNGPMPMEQKERNSKLLREAARSYARALNENRTRRPDLIDTIVFHAIKGMISQVEKVSPADHRYWMEKGWLSPSTKYYYEVPVNPIYLALGKLFGNWQVRKVRKEQTKSLRCSNSQGECRPVD